MDNGFIDHLLTEFDLPLKNPILVFSTILFIILLSPILLRKIKIPGIIGLIVSGMVIGPHGFNVLEKTSAIELFSTIGLLYIMFIAGLELDMSDFKKNRDKSLIFGLLTFSIPIAVGLPICYYVLGYQLNTSILTASMFATHTLIAYPIISKFGISKNEAVAVVVGGTILTDTAVLIILAVIMGAEQGSLNTQFWIKLVSSLAIFMAIMFLIIPRVAKWFFSRLESEKTSHYIFVLSVVFFAAFLAEVAGVEPIIGAFMAGLALNKLIPHSSALMNRVEFVGNAIFIPFFLISVGMLVDLSVIFKGANTLIVAAVLTIVALFGKWLAALVAQLIFKYSSAQRQIIFGLSSAHAAATLAIILVGYKEGILDEYILNGTIILILITCLIASFTTENSAKKIVLLEHDENIDSIQQIDKNRDESVLVPLSNFDNLELIIDLISVFRQKKSNHPISLLSVVENNDAAEINLKKAKKKLSEAIKYAAASEIELDIATTIDNNVVGGITRMSREKSANLVLSGWPQKVSFLNKFLGEGHTQGIIDSLNKDVFACQINHALVLQKRIVVICLPLSEFEHGFNVWFSKVTQFAKELSIPVLFICNERTQENIQSFLKQNKQNLLAKFNNQVNWDAILPLQIEIKNTDLIFMISARKGAISHASDLDGIENRLDKYYPDNNKLLVYPQTEKNNNLYNEYNDMRGESLSKGLETIMKVRKGIFRIFRRN
ncbi:cation:proton antiporter [Pedobacter alpinus]|uniref:Cation:proton antiporter n=1 Tax=Pedobacter alpinus TaxID=1590643 RepID=A0ABW5TRZ2_9SPHI